LRVSLARLATAAALLSLLAPAFAQGAAAPESKHYKSALRTIQPSAPGLQARTEGGDRYLFVKNGTGKVVLVPGYDGEPYLRFLPTGEVDANANSPAKYLNGIRFGTPDRVTIPRSALVSTRPKWEKVSGNGAYRWFDHRTHWMDKKPPPIVKDLSKRTKVFDWKVPATVAGTPVTMLGTLTWIPSESSSTGLSGSAIAAIAVGVVALLALLWLLLRRRRRTSPASPGREKAAKEAW
jgi:LPXTG-motif cell wall-anchored protein